MENSGRGLCLSVAGNCVRTWPGIASLLARKAFKLHHMIKILLSGVFYARIAQTSKPERFFFTNGFIHILMVRTIIC
jgi:hypothetical protein